MSLLDASHPELDLFLQRWRNRLNSRFLAGEALAGWTAAALPALLAAEFSGPTPWVRDLVWISLTGLSAAGFTAWKSRRRLTGVQAAQWLDEAAKTQGLFTAAAECLDKETERPAARRVLDEADRQWSHTGRALRLPWKNLSLRTVGALASMAVCLSVLSLAAPRGLGPLAAETVPAVQARPGTPELPSNGSKELSSKEAAQRLFPEDARLAALAEQALASGDPGALEALMEQNADAVAGKAGSGSSSSRPEGGGPDSQNGAGQQGDPATPPQGAPGKPGSPGSSSGSGSGSKPGSDSDKKGSSAQGEDGQPPQGSGSSRGGLGPGAGQGPGNSGPGDSGGGKASIGSGGAPGKEHSDLAFGPLDRQARSDKKITLKDPAHPGVFEYVLPGAESKLPLAQVLADSRRSAETLVSRTSPPLEFENTIRDYFLSLSQEVSP